jgi:Phage integrase, N-terminal SAM-like domain
MTPLRQRFVDDLRLRNYAARTIEAYVARVVRFSRHFGRSPDVLGPEEIRAFQLHLLERKVSRSQFNQTVCALRFLYGTTLGRREQSATHSFWQTAQAIAVRAESRGSGIAVPGGAARARLRALANHLRLRPAPRRGAQLANQRHRQCPHGAAHPRGPRPLCAPNVAQGQKTSATSAAPHPPHRENPHRHKKCLRHA